MTINNHRTKSGYRAPVLYSSLVLVAVVGTCTFFLSSMYLSAVVHVGKIDNGITHRLEIIDKELHSLRKTVEETNADLKKAKENLEASSNWETKQDKRTKSIHSGGGDALSTDNKNSTGETTLSPAKQLESFLSRNPDSPGARFVKLLRKYLHFEPGAESVRMAACWKQQFALCFGGVQNFQEATGGNMEEPNSDELEKKTKLILWDDDPEKNVYNIRRYHDNHETIPFLKTQAACLPLMLAGYAVQDPNSVVVELGPYAGLSSKCIVTGMSRNGENGGDYHAFDTFEENKNYQDLVQQAPWLKESHPEFNADNTSFLFLWEHGVKPVYPRAMASAGYINASSLNANVLGHKPISLISIDSAKNARQLKQQTAGLGTFRPGTIVILMDFDRVRQQVKQVYGCLRERYLLPVYASWEMEHWAFLVMEEFSLEDSWLGKCYMAIYDNQEESYAILEKLVEADMNFLVGLNDEILEASKTWGRKELKNKLMRKLHEKPWEFKEIATRYKQ